MSSDPRSHIGKSGEQLAAEHLRRRGLRVLERNFRTRWGELDIVATDLRAIVFCEVKTRVAGGAIGGSPFDAIGPAKQVQVRRMAARWLVERSERPRVDELRFDAIGVTLDREGRLLRLDHIEGAF